MQHYIHYGLGFKGELLSDNEYDYLRDNLTFPEDTGEIELNFYSLTEDFEGKNWGVVIVKDFGELGDCGKMLTFNELKKPVLKK